MYESDWMCFVRNDDINKLLVFSMYRLFASLGGSRCSYELLCGFDWEKAAHRNTKKILTLLIKQNGIHNRKLFSILIVCAIAC